MADIPGNTSTTAVLTGTGVFTSSLETNGDSDWWRINAIAGRTYDITLSGDGSPTSLDDAYIILRDATGTQIKYDTVWNGQSETLAFTATSAGPYYIEVQDYSNGDNLPEGSYRLTTRMNDSLPNNATTTAVLTNGTIAGALEANTDSDWYRVTIKAGQSVDFLLSGDGSPTSLDDAYITLRDANGNQIKYDLVWNGAAERLAYTAVTAGTYYIEISDYSADDDAPEGSFRLTTRLTDTVPNNAITTQVLRDGSALTGVIDTSGDVDWVRFDAVAGRTYTLRLTGDGSAAGLADQYLGLLDNNGTRIDYDYAYGAGYALLTFTASRTGRYFIEAAGQNADDWGRYRLSVVSDSPVLTGTAGNDTLTGGANDNRIIGLAGHDSLDGGAGNDTLVGGAGNDTLIGGAGIDTADYSGSAPAHIYLKVADPQNTWHGLDVLSGIENLLGSSAGDRFFGSDVANMLDGAGGNDQLYGGGGDDILIGGAGNDYLHGGAGVDTAVFTGVAAVNADLVAASAVGQGTDTLAGVENLTGAAGNDTLAGNAFANALNGGAGADRLIGRGGSDLLTGGAGADRFVFDNFHGNDRITDFEDGIDRIEIGGPTTGYGDLTIVNWGTNGAVVSWGGGTTITIPGITAAQLTAADFIFV